MAIILGSIIIGSIILIFALMLTHQIYKLIKFSEWTSHLTEERMKLSKTQSCVIGLILIPFNIFFYLLAVLAIFKIDLILPLFHSLK
jgi:hypothetical protein